MYKWVKNEDIRGLKVQTSQERWYKWFSSLNESRMML